jgi:chromosome segregation ATPase
VSTQEERIAALEQRVADIELECLYEKRKPTESTASEQGYDIKQVNHRLTMLLGIASGQEHDLRTIKTDVNEIKEQISEVRQDMGDLRIRLDQRFTTLESKLDQVLLRLTHPPTAE